MVFGYGSLRVCKGQGGEKNLQDIMKGLSVSLEKKISGLLGAGLLVVSGLLVAAAAMAVDVSGLYSEEVIVSDKSKTEFKRVVKSTMEKVLVRVSGDSTIASNPALGDTLSHAERYVLQYGYHAIDQKDGLVLTLDFDPVALNRLLRKSGLPIWASNRPETLVWVGVETDDGGRAFLSGESPELSKDFLVQAERRGVPVQFPLYDLEDQEAITSGDLWGMFSDRVMKASTRYVPQSVLLGKVYVDSRGDWLGRWFLNFGGQDWWYETSGKGYSNQFEQAVDWAADLLGGQFGIEPAAAGFVLLSIEGVAGLDDFARVSRYLNSQVAIRQANLKLLKGQLLEFDVLLEGSQEQFQQALKLDARLVPVGGPQLVPSTGQDQVRRLYYKWQG